MVTQTFVILLLYTSSENKQLIYDWFHPFFFLKKKKVRLERG